MAATALIVAAVFYTSGNTLFAAHSGDEVSASDRQARIEAFESSPPLPLAPVDTDKIPAAVDSMHLAANDRDALFAGLHIAPGAASPHAAPAASAVADSYVHSPAALATNPVTTAAPASKSAPLPAAAPAPAAARQARPALVWIRLWDTDVEDGDAVRIESAGYARTVTLSKQGVTFAVPVPADGQIRITGVRDGDGGGITVGLASGPAQAVLPIMSEGQVLNLNVRTP
ncbi:hypothetical protein [Burkholderia plantarii]|uniref:hypothetical protein n=1 Tax=Burkholderia plantarii TaxID=41899 RepID=UPI0018DD866B|nr:hypothetical protein [Burkholderia plantarii]MBI0325888.1 hypothetical protein [Burkholderia plantarii]